MAETRKRLLASKIETNEGVNASPSATTDAILVVEPEVTVDTEEVEREIAYPWFGAQKVVYSKRQMTFNFDVEISGSGTAGTAPAVGRYLQACGFSETIVNNTVVYSPISSGFPSLTIAFNRDGNQYVGLGCRGTFEMNFTVDEIPRFSFKFMGAFVEPTDVALGTPTYTAQAEPIEVASGNTTDFLLDGHAFCMREFSFDLSNEMSYRQLVGCTKNTRIVDRASEGEIMVERPNALATKNLYPKIGSHTLVAMGFTHGVATGNKVDISLPTIQLAYPEEDDDDGIVMSNYPYRAIPVSPGNNEVLITFR